MAHPASRCTLLRSKKHFQVAATDHGFVELLQPICGGTARLAVQGFQDACSQRVGVAHGYKIPIRAAV
jgi:hypothetical protein